MFLEENAEISLYRLETFCMIEALHYLVFYVGADGVSKKITDSMKILLSQNWQPIVDLYHNLRFHLSR